MTLNRSVGLKLPLAVATLCVLGALVVDSAHASPCRKQEAAVNKAEKAVDKLDRKLEAIQAAREKKIQTFTERIDDANAKASSNNSFKNQCAEQFWIAGKRLRVGFRTFLTFAQCRGFYIAQTIKWDRKRDGLIQSRTSFENSSAQKVTRAQERLTAAQAKLAAAETALTQCQNPAPTPTPSPTPGS